MKNLQVTDFWREWFKKKKLYHQINRPDVRFSKIRRYIKVGNILDFGYGTGILFSYIYFKHFLSEPIILKIYENQYNYSTIKLKGTLIYIFGLLPKPEKELVI
jgi:hypothetical protein